MKYMYTTIGALSGSCIYYMIFEYDKFTDNLCMTSRRVTFSSTGLMDSFRQNIKYIINPGFFVGLFIGGCRDYIDKDIIPAIIHLPKNETIPPSQLIDKPST